MFVGPPGCGKSLVLGRLRYDLDNKGRNVEYINLNHILTTRLKEISSTIESQSLIFDWLIEIFRQNTSDILIIDNTEILWTLDTNLQESLLFPFNRHYRNYLILSISTFPTQSVENIVELDLPTGVDWKCFFNEVPFMKIEIPPRSNFPMIIRRLLK